MANCNHDWVIKDGASMGETYKIAVCSKCLEIGKVVARNEKPDVWAIKDRRITRMSAIKSAIDWCVICKVENTKDMFEVAQKIEDWVYRTEDK